MTLYCWYASYKGQVHANVMLQCSYMHMRKTSYDLSRAASPSHSLRHYIYYTHCDSQYT